MALPLAGGILTAAALYQAPTSYVPTLTVNSGTNPTLGTGATQAGFYYRLGDFIFGEARIRFGSTGAAAGTGTYVVSLPVAANTTQHVASISIGVSSTVGSGTLRDNSSGAASRPCTPYLFTSTSVFMAASSNGNVSDSNPWIWAADDAISIQFAYLRA